MAEELLGRLDARAPRQQQSASRRPVSSSIARLKAWSARAAILAAAGWGEKTAALPAASTLIALLASVGAECVAGSAIATTPHGEGSIRQ